MEVTNEIKAKVFTQYLGQEVQVYRNGEEDVYPQKLDTSLLSEWSKNQEKPVRKLGLILILKSLSSITDEDAIEVARLQYGDAYDWKWVKEKLTSSKDISYALWETYQFLQSKGYDLPHYLLNGKTLKEAGLAIYE